MQLSTDYNVCIISYTATDENGISFSLTAKDPSAPIVKNRAWTTLNAIKSGIDKRSTFIFDKDFDTEKISDVARAIYARYEIRYRQSCWQSFIDLFTCCFGRKSDLEKMQDLLTEILRHKEIEIEDLQSRDSQSEDELPTLNSDNEESAADTHYSDFENSKEKSEKIDFSRYDPFEYGRNSYWVHQGVYGTTLEDLKKAYWNTIGVLNQTPLATNENDQWQLIQAIRLTFQQIEHLKRPVFERYTHHILSHIVILNQVEGTDLAELKLKLFIKAIMLSDDENSNQLHTNDLVSEAVHLDKDSIGNCCKHLPITKDFRLTPFILKTLIAVYAKNQMSWDFFVLKHIQTKEQAIAVIEVTQELNGEQHDKLISALYTCHSFYSTKVMIKSLFEERGLNPENYPSLPFKEYEELFLDTSF